MIGNILRLIRIANDYSVKEVSEKTGISPTYVSQVEHGRQNITLKKLDKYSEVYGIASSKIVALDEMQEKLNLSNQKILLTILEYYVNGKDIMVPGDQSNHEHKQSGSYTKKYPSRHITIKK